MAVGRRGKTPRGREWWAATQAFLLSPARRAGAASPIYLPAPASSLLLWYFLRAPFLPRARAAFRKNVNNDYARDDEERTSRSGRGASRGPSGKLFASFGKGRTRQRPRDLPSVRRLPPLLAGTGSADLRYARFGLPGPDIGCMRSATPACLEVVALWKGRRHACKRWGVQTKRNMTARRTADVTTKRI